MLHAAVRVKMRQILQIWMMLLAPPTWQGQGFSLLGVNPAPFQYAAGQTVAEGRDVSCGIVWQTAGFRLFGDRPHPRPFSCSREKGSLCSGVFH